MKHYIENRIYSTTQASPGAIQRPVSLGFIGDGVDFVKSATDHSKQMEEQQKRWKQNIPQGQAFSTDPEGHNLNRTYGTAVDDRQYSTPPVGDYGMVSPQRNPQGVYGPNMYNASASNTEWGRRQF